MTVLSRKKAWPIADPIGLWGSLCQAELDLVEREAQGAVVVDFGAGNAVLSHRALLSGARHAVAIDSGWRMGPEFLRRAEAKMRMPKESRVAHKIEWVFATIDHPDAFHAVCKALAYGERSLAIVSWPEVRLSGIEHLLRGFRRVLYRGKNTAGTVCGSAGLWNFLASREPIDHITNPQSTCILYDTLERRQNLLFHHEELAGIHNQDPRGPILPFCATDERFPVPIESLERLGQAEVEPPALSAHLAAADKLYSDHPPIRKTAP